MQEIMAQYPEGLEPNDAEQARRVTKWVPKICDKILANKPVELRPRECLDLAQTLDTSAQQPCNTESDLVRWSETLKRKEAYCRLGE